MENRHRLGAGVALTGGAVFDYVSGRVRRGPRLLRENGFEWLARLLVEPRRLWRRYLIGNFLFLLRVLKQRLGAR
jgi:N-acetylglucosaminyldiphosphoundecaprenol N-acetyl-beta-D-mannosaminyltransferase